jgi:dienelactone hydrolase
MRVINRALAGIAIVVLAGSCSSSAKPASTAPTTTSTDAPTTAGAPADKAVYAAPGPFKVGYTTLRMVDRFVDVWYPADAGATAGMAKATYDQTTALPPNLKHLVPKPFNTVVTMAAYQNVAGSSKGPFPVVLFSHGAPGVRMASSALDAGIASWGFVVVSVDYLERGEVTQLPGQKALTLSPPRDKRLMLASLDLVTSDAGDSTSILHGLVDRTRVAAVGHSAGGTTAFDALSDPRVKVAIGWAPADPSPPQTNKPIMIIGGSKDIAVTPAVLAKNYATLKSPKRFVEIGNAGHNSFTDLCVITRSGGGLVGYAIKNHLVAPGLARLLLNGCASTNLAPETFFPVAQHFTVAELRAELGIDPQPVGLGDAVTAAFPGASVTYRHKP